jgi:hypothetical protein
MIKNKTKIRRKRMKEREGARKIQQRKKDINKGQNENEKDKGRRKENKVHK